MPRLSCRDEGRTIKKLLLQSNKKIAVRLFFNSHVACPQATAVRKEKGISEDMPFSFFILSEKTYPASQDGQKNACTGAGKTRDTQCP